MVYAVNWPKLHGNKPIIAKKIKIKKNRAPLFLEPPQGTYTKNFRLILTHMMSGSPKKWNFMLFLKYKMNHVIPIYLIQI